MGFVSYCGCGRCRRRKRGGHGIIKHQLYGRLWFNIWFGPYTFTPLPLVPCSSCAHCFYRFLCKVH